MQAGAAVAGPRLGLLVGALVASLVWVTAAGLAPLVAARGVSASYGQRMSAALVYLGASVICHQRPERSYHLAGVPLPVCARCTGLHAGAAIGLLVVAAAPGAWGRRLWQRLPSALCLAALPTAVSVGVEWLGGGSPLAARTLTAFPAGVMGGVLVGLALAGAPRPAAAPAPQRSATLR
jgi:uncharacterized membrane protein